MIKAVILDFDGTVVDSESVNVAAAIQTFQELGYPLSDAQKERVLGKSSKDFIPVFLQELGLLPELFENLYQKNWKNYLALWDTDMVKPMPFACEVIKALHDRGVVLSIATSNHHVSVEKFISRFGFHDTFRYILTGEDVVERKPHPEIYIAMQEKLALPAGDIIAVEDTGHGLASAKDAGLRCAVVPTSFSRGHDFSRADYILSSLQELPAIVFSQ
ncbi:MAG: HAD family phosphatase [bacterium]|nr:HAD family phosphatase [bacterium]